MKKKTDNTDSGFFDGRAADGGANQPSTDPAYVRQLLKEIHTRDAEIEERKEMHDRCKKNFEDMRDARDKYKELFDNMVKEAKANPAESVIGDLRKRLDEQTLLSKAYATGTGALLRDADTRRKELRLMKARLEAMQTSIEVFLTEESAIRQALEKVPWCENLEVCRQGELGPCPFEKDLKANVRCFHD